MKEEKDEKVEVKENKNKKSNKGIIIGIIVVVAIIAIVGIGFFAYHGQQVALLTTETQKVVATKIVNDDGTINNDAQIDMEIKTKGGYAVVEETLKNYLNETLTLAKEAENIYDEETLGNIVSIENIKNDGPDFIETKAKIAEMKKTGEEYIYKFIELCNEEKLLSAIDDKSVSDYYKKLYKQLATDEQAGKELNDTLTDLENAKTTISESFDYLNNIVNFLSENKSSWILKGKQIMFYDQAKLNEYNKLVLAVPGK